MTSDPFDPHPTSRRRFVLDVFGGLAGTALVGCGAGSELTTTRTGGNGGQGATESGGAAGLGGGENGGTAPGGAGNGGSAGIAVEGGAGTTTGGAAGSGAGGADAGTCALYPQQTEGPFYLDLDLLRSD